MSDFSAQDREAICETFDRLLGDHASEETLREVIKTESGFDAGLWQKMAELGLTGLMISPENDGIGGSIEEAEAVMEVAGAYLYNGPYISTCVVAPSLLAVAENTDITGPHLKNIAAGSSIFAVAGCGSSGDWTKAPEVTATQTGGTWALTGHAHFVRHARNADQFLVMANIGDERAAFLLSANAAGLNQQPHSTDDKTLRLSSLTFDGAEAVRLEGVGKKQIGKALKLGLAALAGEQAGATRKIFDITIEYLNTRFQFGQPIGRFQALKHMAADLLIEVESASSAAQHASRALAANAPSATVLTYLAAFTCADNFRTVAAEAIQLHGGIAYTMEHPAHLYWRRAQTGQWLFGSSNRFRELYLSAMEFTL
ncbi:MAG: acyl-CoA dehydrogenase family protein [Maricaulaceae bacterium]